MKIISIDGKPTVGIYEIMIDEADELDELEDFDYIKPGSKVYCLENSKTYMMDSSGVWTEVNFKHGGGSGNSSYELIKSVEFEINTTSTSEQSIGTISVSFEHMEEKIIYVKIRDKAGKRDGYFYGQDAFCAFYPGANGAYSTDLSIMPRISYYYDNKWKAKVATANSQTGVYVYSISESSVSIKAKFSTDTKTINGTFLVEIYMLDWPDNVSPFE